MKTNLTFIKGLLGAGATCMAMKALYEIGHIQGELDSGSEKSWGSKVKVTLSKTKNDN